MKLRPLKMNPDTMEVFDGKTSKKIQEAKLIGFRHIDSYELILLSPYSPRENSKFLEDKKEAVEIGARELMRERKARGELEPEGYEWGYAETIERYDSTSGHNYRPIHYFLVPKRRPQLRTESKLPKQFELDFNYESDYSKETA